MLRVYIVRHGQTNSNIKNACIGHKDVPLNETGEEQARELVKRLQDIKLDAIYTSPLARTVNTIMPTVSLKKGTQLIMNYGLIERDFGLLDDMSFNEIKAEYPREYEQWMKNYYTYRPPQGESVVDLYERSREVMEKIVSSHKNGSILLVTHGAVSRTIIAYLLGLTVEESGVFQLENASMAIVDYSEEKRFLRGFNK